MNVKAELVKGGQVLGSSFRKVSEVNSDTTKLEEEANEHDYKDNKRYNSNPDEVDPIVADLIKSIQSRQISIDNGASMIVGRIRVKFVEAIKSSSNSDEFSVGDFRYLDDVLFNDLRYVIASVIKFGSRGTMPFGHCLKMIVDTAKMINYFIPDRDYTRIKKILGAVYNEF